MFRTAVVLCAVMSVAFGQIAYAELEKKPEKYRDVEGCYISQMDTVIPYGESMPSNKGCLEYRCSQDYVQYIGCGVAAAQSPCKVVEDLEKPHPDCCPRIECPGNQSNNEENTEVNTEKTSEENVVANNEEECVEKTNE